MLDCFAALTGASERYPLYPPNPPLSKNSCSAGVVSRPNTRLRWGNRPNFAMISQSVTANFICSGSPKASCSCTQRS